jgi:hypothetical protein
MPIAVTLYFLNFSAAFFVISQLPVAKQRSIAEELERSCGEVLKKLEDIRNKIL